MEAGPRKSGSGASHGPPRAQFEAAIAALPALDPASYMFSGHRGYRLMCRFFAGAAWQHPALQACAPAPEICAQTLRTNLEAQSARAGTRAPARTPRPRAGRRRRA